jgi:hypothetical protein
MSNHGYRIRTAATDRTPPLPVLADCANAACLAPAGLGQGLLGREDTGPVEGLGDADCEYQAALEVG